MVYFPCLKCVICGTRADYRVSARILDCQAFIVHFKWYDDRDVSMPLKNELYPDDCMCLCVHVWLACWVSVADSEDQMAVSLLQVILCV
jgi:hypothetical protein